MTEATPRPASRVCDGTPVIERGTRSHSEARTTEIDTNDKHTVMFAVVTTKHHFLVRLGVMTEKGEKSMRASVRMVIVMFTRAMCAKAVV